MKTKIIYISGSEIFDMADIRAAFDEVRAALGLTDTILFGVPVDVDDALPVQTAPAQDLPAAAPAEASVEAPLQEPVVAPVEIIPECPVVAPVMTEQPAVVEPIVSVAEEITAVPVKKSRGRPRKVAIIEEVADKSVADSAPAQSDDNAATVEVTAPADEPAGKIIPILSVLAAKKAEESAPIIEDSQDADIEENEDDATESEPEVIAEEIEEDDEISDVIDDADADIDTVDTDKVVAAAMEIEDDMEMDEVTSVSIDDIVEEDAAAESDEEKTLEQLLESMAPLREDHIIEDDGDAPVDISVSSDTDATLTQLANEFAENQDKIVAPAQNETHGKIGKLKNILPFKKVKRDDNGLMGDLFGWAGIAANDDDFTMPGFFTTAASKK